MNNVSNEATGGSRPLKMVTCGRCKAKTFISGDLAPFATEECKKCGHPIMLPILMHNSSELRTTSPPAEWARSIRRWIPNCSARWP